MYLLYADFCGTLLDLYAVGLAACRECCLDQDVADACAEVNEGIVGTEIGFLDDPERHPSVSDAIQIPSQRRKTYRFTRGGNLCPYISLLKLASFSSLA